MFEWKDEPKDPKNLIGHVSRLGRDIAEPEGDARHSTLST